LKDHAFSLGRSTFQVVEIFQYHNKAEM